jgi:hypothetical protein
MLFEGAPHFSERVLMLPYQKNSGPTAAHLSAVVLLYFLAVPIGTASKEVASSIEAIADCHSAAAVGNLGHPKLFMTAAQLGVAIECARPALVQSLKSSSAALYASNSDQGAKPAVVGIHNNPTLFYEYGNGELDTQTDVQGNRQALITNPGDARLALRLASAAFFVDSNDATNYRALVRLILLHWARHTMVDSPDNRVAARATPEFGLLVGSTSTAFGAAYDLLVAGGGMPVSGDRADVIAWFRNIGYLITESNNNWYNNCKIGAPFSFDGMSCERAKGDNHVSVGSAAVYVAGVLSNNTAHKTKAMHNADPGLNWGFRDRLTTVIYSGRNGGDPPSHPDFFRNEGGSIYINTGEIYDRWRGHYLEKGDRGRLQLHRSIDYAMLNMSFLVVQAMAGKRQGLDLLVPIQKPDGKSISLGNALNYYSFYLKLYNPGEPFTNRTGFLSEPNYATFGARFGYCLDTLVSSEPYLECPAVYIQSTVNDEGFTYNYYHLTFAGAKYLFHGYPGGLEALIDPTVTPTKMASVGFAYSGHIIPFEPALYLEK